MASKEGAVAKTRSEPVLLVVQGQSKRRRVRVLPAEFYAEQRRLTWKHPRNEARLLNKSSQDGNPGARPWVGAATFDHWVLRWPSLTRGAENSVVEECDDQVVGVEAQFDGYLTHGA